MAYLPETFRAAAPIVRPQIRVQAETGQVGRKGGLVLAGEETGHAIFDGIAHTDRMDAQRPADPAAMASMTERGWTSVTEAVTKISHMER